MNSRKNPVIYCIIDGSLIEKKDPVKLAERLFRNGVRIIQLRYKNCPAHELLPIAKKIQRLADKFGGTLIINDRIDVALASNASGVHLGSGDMPPRLARRLLGRGKIIGKTVHSVKDARDASREKADYVGAGPVFRTPLKKGLRGRGLNFIKKVKRRVSVPVFAIGGINERNAKDVLRAGADGVCVARATYAVREV